MISCANGTGTGFYVSEGVVVTAAHVVDGCQNAMLENNSHNTASTTDIYMDLYRDIAVLYTDKTISPVNVIDTSTVNLQDSVEIVGTPIDGLVLSSGRVIKLFTEENEYDLLLDIPADHGNSGGPIFRDGKVIGLVNAMDDDGQIYAMDSLSIEEVLKKATPDGNQPTVVNISNDAPLAVSVIMNVALLIAVLVLLITRNRNKNNQIVINI